MENNAGLMPPEHPEAKEKALTCGLCQWFQSGYNGQTCYKTRNVSVTTVACEEYTVKFQDPFHEMSKDKYIQGIRDALKHNKFKVNEALITELQGYIVNLDAVKHNDSNDLIRVNGSLTTIVAYRSRVTTIYASALEVKSALDEIRSAIDLWLYSKYSTMRDLKNENMRTAAINRIIPEMVPIHTGLNKVMKLSEYLENRLDANEKTIRSLLESVQKLWFSKEGAYGKRN
jgi:hypothetical protein